MSVQWRRSFIGVASLLMTLTFGAQPVLADSELGHVGTVGFHALEDSDSAPGATCRYKSVAEHNDLKLAKMIVEPPLVRAVAGKSAQTVGWKLTVQRRVAGIGGSFAWKNRYTSPEMTAVTDDTHEASFDRGQFAFAQDRRRPADGISTA